MRSCFTFSFVFRSQAMSESTDFALDGIMTTALNLTAAGQEGVVRNVLAIEYRGNASGRRGAKGVNFMIHEIGRQRALLRKLEVLVRANADLCVPCSSADTRFDRLKAELRTIQTWLSEREAGIRKEYTDGEMYAASFYGHLIGFADGLERRYSPLFNGSRDWTEIDHNRVFLRAIEQDDCSPTSFRALTTGVSRRAQMESLPQTQHTDRAPSSQEELSHVNDDLTDLIQ